MWVSAKSSALVCYLQLKRKNKNKKTEIDLFEEFSIQYFCSMFRIRVKNSDINEWIRKSTEKSSL